MPASPSISHRALEHAHSLLQAGRYQDAIAQAEQAERRHGANPASYYLRILGHMCLDANRTAGDIAAQALAAYPDHPQLLSTAGAVHNRNGEIEQARAALTRCLSLHPDLADGWINYTTLLLGQKEYAAASDASARALALAPDDVTALTHHAAMLKTAGDASAAIDVLRRVVAQSPDFYTHRSNLLFFLLFDPAATPDDLLREAAACGRILSAPVVPAAPVADVRAASEKIRIGVMSNDLRQHACAYFLIPLIAHLDRARYEVVCLSLNPREDYVTDKIRRYSNRFVSLAGEAAEAIVAATRAEQLDVLIDLGGHTEGSPLPYMAHGLAPVQMTWLGYPGTTGVPAVGFRITDAVADPDGSDAFYTETLLRAPGVFCPYVPLVQAPLRIYEPQYRVSQTPALRNGYITFGSCNNLNKVTPLTLELWSAVLARCPDSRLLVEASDAGEEAVRAPLLARMTQAGIDTSRVSLVPRDSKNQYLTYHDIDIILDTFPLTGGTTTCDALWMGVPVVSLAGDAFHSRMSTTFLHSVGLGGLSCTEASGYVDTAAALAADAVELDGLRQSIRPRVEQGPICDGAQFAGWLSQQIDTLVAPHRSLPPAQADANDTLSDTLFFGGRSYSLREVSASVGVLIEQRNHDALRLMLEYVAAKWPRHWMIAYALAEIAYQDNQDDALPRSVELLIDALSLRPDHLPLLRLLLARMEEGGYDTAVLSDVLAQQFGLTIEALAAEPPPSVARMLGFA